MILTKKKKKRGQKSGIPSEMILAIYFFRNITENRAFQKKKSSTFFRNIHRNISGHTILCFLISTFSIPSEMILTNYLIITSIFII
jgi:hypothetical protein